jgi:ATP-dependent Clp protease ATP-binding subunit ClpA
MFERFTEASRAVLVEAQDVAVELGSGHLGTGHLLYGCAEVRDDTAGRPLRDAGIDGSLVRQILPRTRERTRERTSERTRDQRTRERRTTDQHPTEQPSTEESGDAIDAEALKALGIDYADIRAAVEKSFGPGALEEAPDRRRPSAGHKPRFTPQAVECLKLSLVAAREQKARRLQPGHLLLGVLRTDDDTIRAVLERAGTSASELETTVIAQLTAS